VTKSSMCSSSSLLGTILSTDHTFKIAKKMFGEGGRVYEAAVLVMNEYNQVIAHYFLQSKSHDELRPLLTKLMERYRMYGFKMPVLW
jgi:hypothetical protein